MLLRSTNNREENAPAAIFREDSRERRRSRDHRDPRGRESSETERALPKAAWVKKAGMEETGRQSPAKQARIVGDGRDRRGRKFDHEPFKSRARRTIFCR
ncbi:MAG: hypothetical protein ACYCVB_16100 [Bacilli bacterium]